MSAVYLYALLVADAERAAAALDQAAGVTGSPEVHRVGSVLVVASAHDGSEILQTRRRMLAHTRVLERLLPLGPVLPMRFGLVAESMARVDQLVGARQGDIERAVARVAGKVELGLRISWPREAALAALLASDPALAAARDRLTGRGAEAHFDRIALGRRVAEALDRRRTDTQRRLLAAIAPHCSAHVVKTPEEDVEALRVECLVDAGEQDRLAEIAEDAAAGSGFAPGADPVVRVVGPVAPYHFVALDLMPAPTDEAA